MLTFINVVLEGGESDQTAYLLSFNGQWEHLHEPQPSNEADKQSRDTSSKKKIKNPRYYIIQVTCVIRSLKLLMTINAGLSVYF